jgi:predicted transcriptional regulator
LTTNVARLISFFGTINFLIVEGEEALARKRSPNLTEGELPLMEVLWKKGRATVGDVATSLPTDPPLAYSTVLTTLRILEAKGYVRHTKKGRAFVYEPVIVQEEARRKALGYLLNRFFGGSGERLVMNLLKEEAIGQAELRRIKKMITESE